MTDDELRRLSRQFLDPERWYQDAIKKRDAQGKKAPYTQRELTRLFGHLRLIWWGSPVNTR